MAGSEAGCNKPFNNSRLLLEIIRLFLWFLGTGGHRCVPSSDQEAGELRGLVITALSHAFTWLACSICAASNWPNVNKRSTNPAMVWVYLQGLTDEHLQVRMFSLETMSRADAGVTKTGTMLLY